MKRPDIRLANELHGPCYVGFGKPLDRMNASALRWRTNNVTRAFAHAEPSLICVQKYHW